MDIFLNDGHLTDQGLQALVDGTLNETQSFEVAEHLSFCDDCLIRYTNLLTDDILQEPEEPLQLPVLRKIREKRTFVILKKATTIAAAAALAVTLWSTGFFSTLSTPPAPRQEKEPSKISTFFEEIGNDVSSFFNSIKPDFANSKAKGNPSSNTPSGTATEKS